MVQNEGPDPRQSLRGKQASKRVTDHLANERTFLAWVRTGIAIMAFGFVVARFGLLLRELNSANVLSSVLPPHISSAIGVTLTLFGATIIVIALFNFLSIRRAIEREEFHPPVSFAIVLTILVSCVGLLLAIYLLLTG
jgi:putative membrane protein